MGDRRAGASLWARGDVQVFVDQLATIADVLTLSDWPLVEGPREVWRRWGDREGGKREIVVQDPDGYLIMIAEDLGERPLRSS